MAWFKYIGDPRHGGEGPPCVVVFGHSFARATAVDVNDMAMIAKLAGNRHFEKLNGEAKPAAAPQTEPRQKGKPRARRKAGTTGAA